MNKLIPLSIVLLATGCVDNRIYDAEPQDGMLHCCVIVDTIHPLSAQMPEKGWNTQSTQSQNFGTKDGTLNMVLTAPTPIDTSQTPAMGIFLTNLNYGPGTAFGALAFFRNLTGNGATWGVSVEAREGDKNEIGPLDRVSVNVTVKGSVPRLRMHETDRSGNDSHPPEIVLDDLCTGISQKILDPVSPERFELSLRVDRTTGIADGAFLTPECYIPISLPLQIFTAKPGDPLISVIGAALAISSGDGAKASAEITDFQVLK